MRKITLIFENEKNNYLINNCPEFVITQNKKSIRLNSDFEDFIIKIVLPNSTFCTQILNSSTSCLITSLNEKEYLNIKKWLDENCMEAFNVQ